jgi:hypothetical protein
MKTRKSEVLFPGRKRRKVSLPSARPPRTISRLSLSQCFRHADQSPGSLFSCRSGTDPLENCSGAIFDGPRTSNLMNRISGSCLSKYDIVLAPTHILKIVEETKGLDDVSFPRRYCANWSSPKARSCESDLSRNRRSAPEGSTSYWGPRQRRH